MDNLSGKTLKGYELLERIGAGGFGAVYRARQTTVAREVAIKIILPGFANKPDFIRRFETEAHLIANLEHLHIVPLYDYWRDPDGAYLVMRYLRGGSLRDVLETGSYDFEATAYMLDQIASSLSAAHRNHVIHRDIKPGNILLDEDGNAYLSDFGIAKDLQSVSGNLTEVDQIVGSLDYLSPEQARSEPVTNRTDIYSLGVMLYEVITGQHPFHEVTSVERLYKHINDPLPDIENLDDDVRDAINIVIQKATSKNPTNRYEDALTMAAEFRQAAALDRLRPAASVLEQLTPREQDILKLLMGGLSNSEIAEQLFVTVSTVKWYNQQLYSKLGVRSRVQAVTRAREMNLFESPPRIPQTDNTDTQIGVSSYLAEPENPYKGLQAFRAADRRDFFGREQLVERLLKRMDERETFSRFLAIVGPSGSGKSSLVKAGLVPALADGGLSGSEKWFHVEMLPGAHPIDELEVALIKVAADQGANLREQLTRDARGLIRVADLILPNDDSKLILVIDQFEEVFTLVEDESSRQHFLDLIYEASTDERSRVCVIGTLRADYYDKPLQYHDFGEMLRKRMETILPLGAKDLERAIVGPANRVKVTFEEGLVADIVAEMTYQASALPLLQYALTELFEKRDGLVMTHQAYQEIGGAVGALAQRADEIYLELDEKGQEFTRQLFLRLVTLGEGAEDTRRRTYRSEILSLSDDSALMEDVIDIFASYRLLSLDNDPATRRPTVEVAHEAILREWERLRNWLSDSRTEIRQQRQLARMAQEWDRSGKESSFLLHGARLQQFEHWVAHTELALTEEERGFVSASLEERQAQDELKSQRKAYEQQLEQRAQTVLRALVAVFAFAAVIAGSFAVFAFGERNRAEDALATVDAQRLDAEQRTQELQASNLILNAREAYQANYPELALSLAFEGSSSEFAPPATNDLLYDIATSPGVVKVFEAHSTIVTDIEFDPTSDHQRFFSSSGYWLFDLGNKEEVDSTIRLWDIESGEELQSYDTISGGVMDLEVSVNGEVLLAAMTDGRFLQWDVATGEMIQEYRGLSQSIRVRFANETGDMALFYSVVIEDSIAANNPVSRVAASLLELRDLNTGEVIHSFEDSNAETVIRDFNYDLESGSLITEHGLSNFAYNTSRSISARHWNVFTGELVQEIQLSGNVTKEIAIDSLKTGFSISGNIVTFATTVDPSDEDSECIPTIYRWNLATTDVETFIGDQITSNAPDRDCIAVQQIEGTANILVNPVPFSGQSAYMFDPHTEIKSNVINANGNILLSENQDYVMFLSTDNAAMFEIETMREVYRIAGRGGAHVSNVPIGAEVWTEGQIIHILAGYDDGLIRHWRINDFGTSTYSNILSTAELLPLTVAYSPDGQTILVGGGIPAPESLTPNELFLIDAVTGETIREYKGHDATIWDVKFTPDGTKAVSVSSDLSTIIWDVESGEILHRIQHDGNTPGFALDISPDGESAYIAIGYPGYLPEWNLKDEIMVIDIATGVIRDNIDIPDIPGTVYAWTVDASPDGTMIAIGTTNNSGESHPGNGVYIFDSSSLEIIQRLPISLINPESAFSESIAFSPDNKTLAISSGDYGVTLWNIETGEMIGAFQSSIETPYHLIRFSPDGQYLAASRGDFGDGGSEDNHISIWSVDSVEEIDLLRGHELLVRGLDFAPDGTSIISASVDQTIRSWDRSSQSIRDWILQNRIIPEISCQTRVQFNIPPLCIEN
jgi:serine/threonine protein kinase/WD40 repeat protein